MRLRIQRLRDERAPRFALVAALFVASACRTPPTSVGIVLGTDAPVDRGIDFRVRVWRADGVEPERWSGFARSALATEGAVFTVVPQGENRAQQVRVLLEARLLSTPTAPNQLLRRALRFTFVPRRPQIQRVFFAMACLNPSTDCRRNTSEPCTVQAACEERDQTCGDEGRCVPIDVVPEDPPEAGVSRDVVTYDATPTHDAAMNDALAAMDANDAAMDASDAAMDASDAAMDASDASDAASSDDAPMDSTAASDADSAADAAFDAAAPDASSDAMPDRSAFDARDALADGGLADGGVGPLGAASEMIVGAYAACATSMASGRAFCWGHSGRGELAVGSVASVMQPTLTSLPDAVLSMSVGRFHGCFVSTNHELRCFGEGSSGQCGAPGGPFTMGVVVSGASWERVATGYDFTCAVGDSGETVRCFGNGTRGQLGNGSMSISTATPVDVMRSWRADEQVIELQAFGEMACVRTNSARMFCWGGGSMFGSVPVLVPLTTVTGMAIGRAHLCATVAGGPGVYCWGQNSDGQVGDGTTTYQTSPVRVLTSSSVSRIAVGQDTTCAVVGSAVRCWGSNSEGQLGQGTSGMGMFSATPMPVTLGGVPIADVRVGETSVCARAISGALHCWGSDMYGQLGDGAMIGLRGVPVVVRVD